MGQEPASPIVTARKDAVNNFDGFLYWTGTSTSTLARGRRARNFTPYKGEGPPRGRSTDKCLFVGLRRKITLEVDRVLPE